MSLKGRDFLTLKDFTRQEIEEMVSLGIDLKAKQKAGIPTPILEGKTLGMIFQKSSTRTRVSFEVGMYQLGGSALFLSTNDLQIGRGEPIKDTLVCVDDFWKIIPSVLPARIGVGIPAFCLAFKSIPRFTISSISCRVKSFNVKKSLPFKLILFNSLCFSAYH